jgi:hypothetical protein
VEKPVGRRFIRPGASAMDDRRPEFQRMVERACDGKERYWHYPPEPVDENEPDPPMVTLSGCPGSRGGRENAVTLCPAFFLFQYPRGGTGMDAFLQAFASPTSDNPSSAAMSRMGSDQTRL